MSDLSEQFHISYPANGFTLLFPEGETVRTSPKKLYFIVTLCGNAIIELDDIRYQLRQGSFLFLTPSHLICLLTSTEDFRVGFLSFEFEYLSDFPLLLKADLSTQAHSHPFLQLDETDFERVKKYFIFIAERCGEEGDHLLITKGLLFSFILEIILIYSGKNTEVETSRQNEITDRFFCLLHKYYKSEHSAAFYANTLCISDKHFMRTIKKITGHTFHFWICDFVLKEAQLLLKSTDKTVTEIAEDLHFPNSSFFARFFRRYMGMSPKEFRNT